MNAIGPKERVTFSLSAATKDRLEAIVPKSKRSNFVDRAIEKALKDAAVEEARAAVRKFKPYPLKGPGTVETLRQIRVEREEQLASRHTPAKT